MCGGFFGCVYLPQVLLWRWFMWRIFFKRALGEFFAYGDDSPRKLRLILWKRLHRWPPGPGDDQRVHTRRCGRWDGCRNTAAGAQQAAFHRVLCLDWQLFKDQILFRCWFIYGHRKIEVEPAIGWGCCDITKDWFPMPRVHVHTSCNIKWALQ